MGFRIDVAVGNCIWKPVRCKPMLHYHRLEPGCRTTRKSLLPLVRNSFNQNTVCYIPFSLSCVWTKRIDSVIETHTNYELLFNGYKNYKLVPGSDIGTCIEWLSEALNLGLYYHDAWYKKHWEKPMTFHPWGMVINAWKQWNMEQSGIYKQTQGTGSGWALSGTPRPLGRPRGFRQ